MTILARNHWPTLACIMLLITVSRTADSRGLSVEQSETGKAYLVHKGKPLFAFGPGDELRTLSGANDVKRWVQWQKIHGMNLIRAYPLSVPADAYGAPGLGPFLQRDGKWDVDAFNDVYFKNLGETASLLDENDIILHLQLWQIVFFKGGENRWDKNFLNPMNNVNEWTHSFSRGRDYIDAPPESRAREHQREWVRHILDALKGRENLIIDVINELGNEMGSLEWAVEVVGWVRAWERGNDWTFLVGVDSEHHYTPERFGPHKQHFDLIILNEFRSREHVRRVIETFNKPAVSVRSSDGLNRWEDYMFANADQVGPEHQTRYRTLCYRSLFAGLQSVGAYWKPTIDKADYQDMVYWPEYARALRAFWDRIAPYWPLLKPADQEGILPDPVTPHAHILRSPSFTVIYLECGSHTWNNTYPASRLRVRCDYSQCEAVYFNPSTGESSLVPAERQGEWLRVSLPTFVDDAVLFLHETRP